jgi:hypothetical protein
MRVSFDLDDTLVCGNTVPTEQFVPLWARRRYPEGVRRGCRELMRSLVERGCRIWVYTSSRRSPRYVRAWFRSMGIRLEGVVTLCRHEEVVGHRGPSKYPPAFGIGLHVDDSHGVGLEGSMHGFRVVVVDPHDESWTSRVLAAVDAMLDPVPLPVRKFPRIWTAFFSTQDPAAP